MKKKKCLVCGGNIKDNWKIDGVIDIRSYTNIKNKKMYNVFFNIDGWEDGMVDSSLKKILRDIAKKL